MSGLTDAASVLLARGPDSPEVYLVRRADNLRFFGGFWAFPGGKVAAADAAVPLHWDAAVARPGDLATTGADRLAFRRVAAARDIQGKRYGEALDNRRAVNADAPGADLETICRLDAGAKAIERVED